MAIVTKLILLLTLLVGCKFRLDITSPHPTITLESQGIDRVIPSANLSAYNIQGSCRNANEVNVRFPHIEESIPCVNQRYSRQFDLSSLSDGEIPLKLKALGKTGVSEQDHVLIKDTIPPSAPLIIQGIGTTPTSNTSSRSISIFPSEDDYLFKMKHIQDGSCGSVDFSAVQTTTSRSFNLSLVPNAQNTVCIQSADKAANWRMVPVSSNSIYLDTVSPQLKFEQTRIETADGVSLTINWTLTEHNPDPAENMVLEYSPNGSVPWTELHSQTVGASSLEEENYSFNWVVPSITTGNGKLRLRFKDLVGHEGTEEVPLIIDNASPTLNSIILANGVPTVGIPTIQFQLSATPSFSTITELRVSEDISFSGASWRPFNAGEGSFTLSLLPGNKTVYAQVRSSTGHVSNIVSGDILLDFGSPPNIMLTSPLAGTFYAPGTSINIEWTCSTSSSAGLAPNPITEIRYSVDDGLSYHTIASNLSNNLTPTSGSYSWSIPFVTPTGQTVSSTRPLRVVANCSSAAGVVSSGMSELLNSQWTVLAGEPGNINENVHISTADLSSISGVFGDSKNAIFYARKNAIMKMDPVTGLVSSWLGNMELSGCDYSGGLLSGPLIFDISPTDEMLFYSPACSTLYKVDIATKNLIWSRSLVMEFLSTNPGVFYLKSLQKLLYSSKYALYLLDLSSPSTTPERLMGEVENCAPLSGEDTLASESLLPCQTGGGYAPLSTPDLSKIWLTNTSFKTSLEKDENGVYRIKATSISENLSRCVQTNFESDFIFCVMGRLGSTSRTAAAFNTATASRLIFNLPVYNNLTSNQIYLGSGKDSLFYLASTNELFDVRYESGNWSALQIGGTAFHTYGNGSDIKKVAFTHISSLAYDPTYSQLYVRGAQHIRRLHINTMDPMAPFVDSIESASGSNITNSSANYGLAVSSDGNLLANVSVSSDLRGWRSVDLTTWDALNNFVSNWTYPHFYNRSGPGTAYPLLGESFASTTIPYLLRRSALHVGTFLPNGKFYFDSTSDTSNYADLWIFESTGQELKSVVGADGMPGYENSHGTPALGARLSWIHNMQADADGDLLLFDGKLLRKVSIVTEPSDPKIYDIEDFSTFANYPGDKIWNHAVFDNQTGWSYFVIGEDISIGQTAEVWAARADQGFVEIPTDGILLTQINRRSLQLEITPLGLLLLDSNKKRILRTDLKN